LGVEAFWRLARKYKDIEKLLAALKEESLPLDSTRGRLARAKHRQEEWEAVALRADISRLEAHLRELRFEARHWDIVRYYHDRLGMEKFWRIAREYRDIERLRAALRRELRQELLAALDDRAEGRFAPDPKDLARTGLIEISPPEYKHGKTTDGRR
jgi:hypothetical protein